MLTFSTYGTRLHGRDNGSVDRNHNQYNTPFLEPDGLRRNIEQKNMKYSAVILGRNERQIVLDAACDVCKYKNWGLFAAHIRTEHVHLVLNCSCPPHWAVKTIKAWATKSLRAKLPELTNQKIWTRNASTKYIWKSEDIRTAIAYVIARQGEPMQMYCDKQYYDYQSR